MITIPVIAIPALITVLAILAYLFWPGEEYRGIGDGILSLFVFLFGTIGLLIMWLIYFMIF